MKLKAKRRQFSIRWLLLVTTVAAMVTGAHCVDPFLGFLLMIIVTVLWSGGMLRTGAFEYEATRNYAGFGAIWGGAFAGGIHAAFAAMSGTMADTMVACVCAIGAMIGLVVWIIRLTLICCFRSVRGFIARAQ